MQGDDRRVYEFIARHFLACCSQDAKGFETVIHLNIAGEEFTCKGLVIHERNFLEVYPYWKWEAKVIPKLERGETIEPEHILFHEGVTTPPNLLAEEDLVSLMDKNNIGTDATIAEHIQKIQDRKYAHKEV